MAKRRWHKVRKPPDIERVPTEGPTEFKPGDRVKIVGNWREGTPVIVIARVPGAGPETYKVSTKLEKPHDQRSWLTVPADFLGFDSAVDKLGSLILDEHGEIDDD